MIEIGDTIFDFFRTWRIIDVQDDHVVALLLSDYDGMVDQEEDNLAGIIMRSDIDESGCLY